MAELVDDLQSLGYVQRTPDPQDGRAKLVCLTPTGWQAITTGRAIITQIESDWGDRITPHRFQQLCQTMQDLLDELDPDARQHYTTPADAQPPPSVRR